MRGMIGDRMRIENGRSLRLARMMTAIELASNTGLSTKAIYALERGKSVSVATARKYLEGLGLNPRECYELGILRKGG